MSQIADDTPSTWPRAEGREPEPAGRFVDPSGSPERVLAAAIEALPRAGSGSETHLYVLDAEVQRLVLAAGTDDVSRRHAGLEIDPSTGAMGKAVESGEPYLIAGGIDRDPYFRRQADLGEERFDGMVCVPMLTRSARLFGVLVTYSVTGAELTPEFVAELSAACSRTVEPLSAALARARDAQRLHALERIAKVSTTMASGISTTRMLDFVTEIARDASGSDLALLLVADPNRADRLVFKSVAPNLSVDQRRAVDAVRRQIVSIDSRVRDRGVTWPVAAHEMSVRLQPWFGTATTVPVRMAGEEFGVLCCYRASARRFGAADQGLLAPLGSQVAVQLKLGFLAEELHEQNPFARFVRDIMAARLDASRMREHAAALDLEIRRQYCFVLAQASREQDDGSDPTVRLRAVERALNGLSPGARTFLSGREVLALVPCAADDRWPTGIVRRLEGIDVGGAAGSSALTFAVSQPIGGLGDFGTALGEVRDIASVVSSDLLADRVFTIDDVSHRLLLRRAADQAEDDRYSAAVAAIADYDRVKQTALVKTLAVFLHLRNRTDAARELYVHRNTLAQRLRRIEELTGLDIGDPDEWFPLQLALKIHALREPPNVD